MFTFPPEVVKRREKPDILEYEWHDVLGGINPPKQVPKRGFYSIPELSIFVYSDCQLVGYNVLYMSL
jgi:hypothetical protein